MSYVNGNPHLPYRIPAGPSEGRRLLSRWKSFNRMMKLGIVGGGLLSLVAVGAMATPLVASADPLKHLPFGGVSEVRTSGRVTSKATEPSHPVPSAKAAPAEPSRTPATTLPAAPKTEPTKAPATKATEPTKAATTKAGGLVKTSTTPLPTTPKPSTSTTSTTTPSPTKTTTSATTKPTVTPNAICTVAGATGVSATGTAMVCRTTTTDPVLRWRVVV